MITFIKNQYVPLF